MAYACAGAHACALAGVCVWSCVRVCVGACVRACLSARIYVCMNAGLAIEIEVFESPLIPFRSLGILFLFTMPQFTRLYK